MAENSLGSRINVSSGTINTKFQKFLNTLIRLAGGETTKTAPLIKKLIQNLIDEVLEPEEFSAQLQTEFQLSQQPYIAHFLEENLPLVRQALIKGEMTIEGIRPPPVSASVQKLVPIAKDLTTDIEIGKAIAGYLGKSKVLPEHQKPSSELEMAQIMHIRDFKTDAAVRKELKDKMVSLVEKHATNSQERVKLLREIFLCINIEQQRKSTRRIVTLNRRRGQLKKIWESRGLRVDEDGTQMASSKDVFDMSSLSESLPSKPGDSDIRKIAEKLAKEYLSFVDEKTRSFRRSEIFRILASNAPEQSIESSLKNHRTKSLTRLLKNVCGDVRNARIFSFRPLLKKCSNCNGHKIDSCPELQKLNAMKKEEKDKRTLNLDGVRNLQNVPFQREKVTYRMGPEMLVLLKSPSGNTGEKRSNVDKDHVNTASNLQNPELCLFNKDHRGDEHQKTVSLQKQQLHESISLSRQMSRLKIANSSRGDMDESEIQEASADQNKKEQEKVTVANKRRELLERLREKYRQHQLKKETEAQNKN